MNNRRHQAAIFPNMSVTQSHLLERGSGTEKGCQVQVDARTLDVTITVFSLKT